MNCKLHPIRQSHRNSRRKLHQVHSGLGWVNSIALSFGRWDRHSKIGFFSIPLRRRKDNWV